jgi:hypothetical protein
MGQVINSYKILVGNPEGNRKLGRRVIGGRIILNCILNKVLKCGLDSTGS